MEEIGMELDKMQTGELIEIYKKIQGFLEFLEKQEKEINK